MQAVDDYSLHPIRALHNLFVVVRDPENTVAGAVMVRSLEGRSRERFTARFVADPMGAQILAEGRRLERALCDREALAAMPTGSLGQSYEAWTRAEGISAEGLAEATREAGYAGTGDGESPLERLQARGAAAHDLWHVVTGYGRDHLGELALLHFTMLQTGNSGFLLPCWLGLLAPVVGRDGRRLIFEARRRARRASWLPAADWEALLPQPLPTVRERLGVGAPAHYTPVWGEAHAERSESLTAPAP